MQETSEPSSFFQRLLSAPEGMSRELARFYVIGKVGFPLGVLFHAVFALVFFHLDLTVLAIFNLVSVVAWVIGTWLLYNNRWVEWTFAVLLLFEVPLHGALATLYLGFESAFFLLVLPTIYLPILAPYYTRRMRLILCSFNVALLVALSGYAITNEPWREVSQGWLLYFAVTNVLGTTMMTMAFVAIFEHAVVRAETELAYEFDRAERLLKNILPEPIAARLKENPDLIADEHKTVTVLFADIVGFTATSTRLPPAELVTMLNRVFSRFDDLVAKYGVEKIKTIGDAYMVVAGLPREREDHAEVMTALALEMLDVAEEINADSDVPIKLRIGINTGPVVAGVIGQNKFAYDLWGDTVNIAARMEETGRAGTVQITQSTRDLLGERFRLQDLGMIAVKGKGEMKAYSVAGATA